MPLKVWNGSSYIQGTGLKVWNGSSWVNATSGKVWNGSSWVEFFSSGVVSFEGFTSLPDAIAFNLGTASATVTVTFDTSGNIIHDPFATGFPDGGSTVNPGGFSDTWLTGGTASDFSLKYTFTAQTPTAQRGGASISPDTWYAFTGNFTFEISASRSGLEGTTGASSNITISIARTSDTSTVLDSAVISLGPQATVFS